MIRRQEKMMYRRVESLLDAGLRAVLAPAVAVLLISLSSGSAHASPITLYATTFNENQLLQINLSTGAGTVVGTILDTSTADLASFGGNLYALDQASTATFNLIDPSTAAILSSTNLGVGIGGEGGFTFNAAGGAFVSNSAGDTGQLFGCDVTVNNGCTVIGGGSLTPSMDALAVSAANVLYGMSQSPVGDVNPSLYIINQTTGVTSLVGSTGQTGNDLGGLAFDPQNGVLYSAFNGELYTVNTSTGAVTAVGAIGFTDISGLAFLGTVTATPEPGTAATLATGMLALLSVAIARRRLAARRQV